MALCPAVGFRPWDKQRQVMQADYEVRVLPWANRTGKTTLICCEAVLAGMGMHPWIKYPAPPFTIWAVSNSYKQMEDSFRPAFEGDATHPRMLPHGVGLNQQRMEYLLPSGSKIRLKTAESGRDAFQGAALPLILLDEDLPTDVLKEIFSRLITGEIKRRILWAITAVNGLTYSYQYFYLPWKAARDEGRQHPSIFVLPAAMDENPYLSPESIETFCLAFPKHSKEYKVRRYGGYENLAGDSVFSEESIDKHSLTVEPVEPRALAWQRREVHSRPARTSEPVPVLIWKPPQPGHRYTVGADIAEGKLSNMNDADSARDWSAAAVLDRDSRAFVARIRTRVDPHQFGVALWLLAMWYNKAWLCPEVNHNGVATLGVLRGSVQVPGAPYVRPYPRIYARERNFDQYSQDQSNHLLGFKTTTLTRPKLIADFYDMFTSAPCLIRDGMLLEECKSFQRNKQGKAEHTSGFHDDILFAYMLAVQADLLCPQMTGLTPDSVGVMPESDFDPSVVPGLAEDDLWVERYAGMEVDVA